MKLTKILFPITLAAILVASCSTPKDVTYFQDAYSGDVIRPSQQFSVRVKPEDKLSIMVTTPDPALSMLFNLVQTQNRLNGSTGTKSAGASASSEGRTSYYTVDQSGDINFPVLGRLHIAGMTRAEVCEYIEKELVTKDLVKDPIVTVEYANTGITVMGEVKSPGRLEFNKDHMTIVEAIAMAGDLTTNGMRNNILVLRTAPDGSQQAYRVSLLDLDALAATPVYYMQQDDVIYVQPNDKAKRETTPNGNTPYTPSFWVSIGSFGVTIATLIITLTK